MYVPDHFAEHDLSVLHGWLRRFPFGLLVTAAGGGFAATHLPFWLDPARGQQGTLYGHVARANPHWQCLDGSVHALAVFSGPHAYVSPRWYQREGVPTWNYVAVHAEGRHASRDPAAAREAARSPHRTHDGPGGLSTRLPRTRVRMLARHRRSSCRSDASPARRSCRRTISRGPSGVIAGLDAQDDAARSSSPSLLKPASDRLRAASSPSRRLEAHARALARLGARPFPCRTRPTSAFRRADPAGRREHHDRQGHRAAEALGPLRRSQAAGRPVFGTCAGRPAREAGGALAGADARPARRGGGSQRLRHAGGLVRDGSGRGRGARPRGPALRLHPRAAAPPDEPVGGGAGARGWTPRAGARGQPARGHVPPRADRRPAGARPGAERACPDCGRRATRVELCAPVHAARIRRR